MTHQPHRVRLELPDGGGVVLEPVCALCHEVADAMMCPICERVFCAEGCFEVHLNARDALDSNEAFDKFLAAPISEPFRELIDAHSETKIDWYHTRHCRDCSDEMRITIMELLIEGLQDAMLQDREAEA